MVTALGTILLAAQTTSGKRIMEETASSSGMANSDLEAMMAELGLKEDELQDVVVDEGDLPEEATRWMAIARVHTEKPYSQYWFYRNMRVAWDLA